MGISLGGARLRMPEQFADHFQRGAAADQQRGEGVAQVVNAHIEQVGLFLNADPEPSEFLHRLVLALDIARKQPVATGWHGAHAGADQRHRVQRDRHPVDAALLGIGGRFGPDGAFQIEMLETGSPHLANPGAGQHAHADDGGGALVLGCSQRITEPGDLVH